MKVSVVTVCFNSATTLGDTLDSIRNQTYDEIEYIVIDGGSTDKTLEIIEQNMDLIDVLVSEPDKGLYDAMNKGIKLATGDVIGILNSDDVYSSERSVEKLLSGFSNDSNIDAVYSDLMYVSQHNLNKPTRLYSSKIFNKSLIKLGIMLPHPTFYVRAECYKKYGDYKLNYRVAADFELIARMVSNEILMKRVPFVSIRMREGGISSRGLYWRIHQNLEIIRACRENGIYTNPLLVMLKLPYKLATLMTRWFVKEY